MSRFTTTAKLATTAAFIGSTVIGAPGASAATTPSGTASLNPIVSGQSLMYTLSVAGNQYQYTYEDGKLFTNPNPTGFNIDFGDGQADGGDGGIMDCKPGTKLSPFNMTLGTRRHTYAKPGTYTVTVTSGYCGAKGVEPIKKTYKVTVPSKSSTADKPWAVITLKDQPTGEGMTQSVAFSVEGQQYQFRNMDGSLYSPGSPSTVFVDWGDRSEPRSPVTQGCTPGTKMAPFGFDTSAATFRHTYAKPGNYDVKIKVGYCGSTGIEYTTEYLSLTAQRKTSVNPKPSSPTKPVASTATPKSATTGSASTPAQTPAAKKTGPAVVTDKVGGSQSNHTGEIAGGIVLASLAAAGAGVAMRGRRRQPA